MNTYQITSKYVDLSTPKPRIVTTRITLIQGFQEFKSFTPQASIIGLGELVSYVSVTEKSIISEFKKELLELTR